MSKRDGRTSAITGASGETSIGLSPEQLAMLGYSIPDTRHMGVDAEVPSGAIVPQDDGSFIVGQFTLTPTGVQIPEGVSSDDWGQLGDLLFRLNGSIQWLIGDWLNYGARTWGKTYDAIAEATGYEVSTLYNLAMVSSKVDFSLRNEKLSFTHHMLVASRSPEEQRYWLARAVDERWSAAQLRAAMKTPTPLSSGDTSAGVQKRLISHEKPREVRQFLKLASKAGQGDPKAKQRALGQIVQLRQWLDDVEEWLKHE